MRAVLIGIMALLGAGFLLCVGLTVPMMVEGFQYLPTALQGASRIFGLYWSWVQENPWQATFGLLLGVAVGLFINALMVFKGRRNSY